MSDILGENRGELRMTNPNPHRYRRSYAGTALFEGIQSPLIFHGISKLFLTGEPSENEFRIAKFANMAKSIIFTILIFLTFPDLSRSIGAGDVGRVSVTLLGGTSVGSKPKEVFLDSLWKRAYTACIRSINLPGLTRLIHCC